MTRAHLKYRKQDFLPRVLGATEDLFAAKPWRLDIGQLDLFQRWADIVCEAHEVPPVGIHKIDHDAVGFGYLVDETNDVANVLLGRYSLATLFCGVGAHISLNSDRFNHIEWGFSLFYIVRPVMFRRRVREGRIEGLTARDTFSRATWDRLTVMGLTNGNLLVDPHFDIRTLDAEDDLVNPDEVAEASEDTEGVTIITTLPNGQSSLLASLPIVELRRLSRGLVSGGYNMRKDELITALVEAGVRL
jgi:hypothetical protein